MPRGDPLAWLRELPAFIIDLMGPMAEWEHLELRLDAPPPDELRGEGVRIAVVDSGVHAAHPHVGGVAGGVAIGSDGSEADDYVDWLGHGTAVTAAIREKAPQGAVVVTAGRCDGVGWLPGAVPGTIGVLLDWSCSRHAVRVGIDHQGHPAFLASGFPRPIPGVSPARNLGGISFAVANVTGVLARLLEAEPEVGSVGQVFEQARRYAVWRPATQ